MGQTAVTWAELGAVIGFICFAGATVAAVVVWLWTKFNIQEKSLADYKLEAAKEIASFRLETARTYVTVAALTQVEETLTRALDKLGEKIERLMEARRS